MLSHIGQNRIFEQYTRHDITHINELLRLCDTVIPPTTRETLTPVDWLLLTLGIYFHDLGMLVSTKEYEDRARSGFEDFCRTELFTGESGRDYEAKVAALGPERERFLYQEYVRHTHAERIRHWVLGEAPERLGASDEAASELNRLLEKLPLKFRQDLGLICESHHRDDLDDFTKYRVSQPYGPEPEAAGNVHYAALIVRTVDILHMTSDRTPSISFKLVNPSDPISQREWAKQMGVTTIRPRRERNRDGQIDDAIPPSVIEVHALFQNPAGFFALTAFLTYVRAQLNQAHEWSKQAHRHGATKYEFPWRDIDESGIETVGFMKRNFEFTLDQGRILDLLTGHTLYNDSLVAVRELIQNAIDATRVERLQTGSSSSEAHEVVVRWDSKQRILEVQDCGTGMTQEIIENHLLKVGSSRYQDQEFRKQHPSFAPISRFGIGLLSSFMVADSVEIVTCHPDEAEARHLSLRSVHGKYLIRLLNKDTDATARKLSPHGTLVRLQLRPSAELRSIASVVSRWIAIPECPVVVEVDGVREKEIRPRSLADVLKEDLRRDGISFDETSSGGVRVREETLEGVTIAFAVQWSEWFKEWSFLRVRDRTRAYLGTCVEGIRVDFETPGYHSSPLYAVVNVTGLRAPRTNVARSGFEDTQEYASLLRAVYRLYCGHLVSELNELIHVRNFSLTWAVREARYLSEPLFGSPRHNEEPVRPKSSELLLGELRRIPILVTESPKGRTNISADDLAELDHFWTIDCELMRSAERLLGEVSGNASLRDLGRGLSTGLVELPEQTVLSVLDKDSPAEAALLSEREVDRIVIDREQRRVDLRWTRKDSSAPRWLSIPAERLARPRIARRGRAIAHIRVGTQPIELSGSEATAIESFRNFYILPGNAFSSLAAKWLRRASATGSDDDLNRATGVIDLIVTLHRWRPRTGLTRDSIAKLLADIEAGFATDDVDDVTQVVNTTRPVFFSTSAWVREAPHF